MDETIHRFATDGIARKTLMLFNQSISELCEDCPCVRGGVGAVNAVMQVYLYLSQFPRLQVSQHLKQWFFILLSGIKIRVTKWDAFAISKGVTCLLSHSHPLLNSWYSLLASARFKVVGDEKDDVHLAGSVKYPTGKFVGSP